MKTIKSVLLFILFSSLSLNGEKEFYTPKEDLNTLKQKQVHNSNLPNVLIIGDSISIGYTKAVAKLLDGVANVSRPANRRKVNCGDTKKGLVELSEWLGDKQWDVIHFNWGLHDLCYRHPDAKVYGHRDKVNGAISVPLENYRKNLEKLVQSLSKSGAKLIWANTTVVPEGEAGRHVGDDSKYNKAAEEVMNRHDIIINDLHGLTSGFDASLFSKPGDVHFNKTGNQLLAKQVASKVMKALAVKKKQDTVNRARHRRR